MARRSGTAILPLHGGRVPPWLATRMSSLGAVITQAIVHHYGRDEFLQRLSHPFWFQSFGAVMGMDWHSSGITTSVIGALKRGLGPLSNELGIHVCGGRGQHSGRPRTNSVCWASASVSTPPSLTRASRLVAKVDSAAVQDGFDLYLHGFFVTDDGNWTVVQQGMNGDKKQARRYHWHSENLKSFVDEPHSAIDGPMQGEIVNLTDKRAETSRAAQTGIVDRARPGPYRFRTSCPLIRGASASDAASSRHAGASRRPVQRRLHASAPRRRSRRRRSAGRWTFPICCSLPASARARSARSRWSPRWCTERPIASGIPRASLWRMAARIAIPTRFPLKCYDETIRVMKSAVQKAKLGRDEEMQALKRLDSQARRLEGWSKVPRWRSFIAVELAASPALGGRSVFGWEKDLAGKRTADS